MSREKKWYHPQTVMNEYRKGQNYKTGMGNRGLYEQSRINQRFFEGDQWYGVQCGDKKALIRYNIIKRIGDYKMAMVDGSPLAVNFSAEGVACTKEIRDRVRQRREQYRKASSDASGQPQEEKATEAERVGLIMEMLGAYYKTTAERLCFDTLKNAVLHRAYISGTGILYTYWDDTVQTGQYADEKKTSPIRGDIRIEALDVENVYFGDPTLDDVQGQPYIIIAQRRRVDELKREARRNGRPAAEVEAIKADGDTQYSAGDAARNEPTDSKKATVLTKLYKDYGKDGVTCRVMAVRVTEGAIIRPPWDIGVHLYPIAKMNWGQTPNCAYGYSEVTHLIQNQIAINRAATAAMDAVMKMGMPILLYDTDVIIGEITNEPGQTIPVAGMPAENPVRYVAPQNFTPQFDQMIDGTISATMSCAGANDAALGDMRPENASAIHVLYEAATMPLQLMKNRWYAFVEEVARIWLEFWVNIYAKRALKINEDADEWYFPFDAETCKDLVINTRVDVGPANLWSEINSLQTLDNLYKSKIIDAIQYLKRLPKGSVPELSSLIRELEEAQTPAALPVTNGGTPADVDPAALIGKLPPEYQNMFQQMTPEQQQQVLAKIQGST